MSSAGFDLSTLDLQTEHFTVDRKVLANRSRDLLKSQGIIDGGKGDKTKVRIKKELSKRDISELSGRYPWFSEISAFKQRRAATILHDERYLGFAARYRNNTEQFCVECLGIIPTWQQLDVLNALDKVGARVTVSSGHGTGKSFITAAFLLNYIICHPMAVVMLTANNIKQVSTVVWKYLKGLFRELEKNVPWIGQYFVLAAESFYAKGFKGEWHCFCRTCRPGNEESLAGQHAKHYCVIVDEASGVTDKAIGVMEGALTEDDNRMLMLSQPTQPVGRFYDSHHKESKQQVGEKKGIWDSFTLNSELSPLVKESFIREKMISYGGRESPMYQIKVLGLFPQNLAGWLIPRIWIDNAQKMPPIEMDDDWGYLACVDVSGGTGRDKSVLSIFKVSGWERTRKVDPVLVHVFPGNVEELQLTSEVDRMCNPKDYPNMIIAVDADGSGRTVAQGLENKGRNVHRIRWGKPLWSEEQQGNYFNQRAYASDMSAQAIRYGRMRLDKQPDTAEQFSKLPYKFSEKGQLVIRSKEWMANNSIKSPDIADTYCFAHLVKHIPARITVSTSDQNVMSELDALWNGKGN